MKAMNIFVAGMWLMSLALFVLKIGDLIDVSWWVVSAPLLVPMGFAIVGFIIVLLSILIAAQFADKPGYRSGNN
jgi:hypothetical protein